MLTEKEKKTMEELNLKDLKVKKVFISSN